MNLVIDYGNSAAKVGIFSNLKLVEQKTFRAEDDLRQFMQRHDFEHVVISSVATDATRISEWGAKARKIFIVNRNISLPVKNHYVTPETLGMDRLAAVCGAHQLFPEHDCLVVDAGTCIKYDFVDKGGNYLGGGISPGLHMRFQAVHSFTAKLPLVVPKPHVSLIGTSTETCIQSGVVNGAIAEIDGIIGQYREKSAGLKVILCGGDAGFFENQLKASIFASPELVLVGLNSILIHNVSLS